MPFREASGRFGPHVDASDGVRTLGGVANECAGGASGGQPVPPEQRAVEVAATTSRTPAPPDDAEDWTDDQWLEWLAGEDGAGVDRPHRAAERPPGKASLGQAMLAGGLIGLHEVFYGPRDEDPVLVVDADEPLSPNEMEVHLEPGDPRASWVRMSEEHPPPER